jgi:hypothetical protein
MHCHHQSTLHQICTNKISNDNVHQGLKANSSDENIYSFLCMVGKKVGNLFLYVGSIFQRNSCNGISKRIMGCNVLIPAWAM